MKAPGKKIWVGCWALYLSFLLLLSKFSAFKILGVPTMSPSFADLRFITSASDCYSAGGWSMTGVSCDPWGRPFNYPSLWVRIFSFLDLGEAKTDILGILELVILSASLIYWVRWAYSRLNSDKPKEYFAILTIFILVSPPILLLAERGNVDIVIFAGMTLAYFMASRSAYLSAGLLVSFLGTLKLYPFFGLTKLLEFRKRVFGSMAVIFCAVGGTVLILGELKLIASRSENGWNSISYGISVLPLLLLRDTFGSHTKLVAALFGAVILIVFAFVFSILKAKKDFVTAEPEVSNYLLNHNIAIMSLLFLASYLSGTSYDYRLITLLPVLFMFLVSIRSKSVLRLFTLGALVSLYFGHLTSRFGDLGLILNIFGDTTIALFASYLLSFYIDRLRASAASRKHSNV